MVAFAVNEDAIHFSCLCIFWYTACGVGRWDLTWLLSQVAAVVGFTVTLLSYICVVTAIVSGIVMLLQV